jgi:hypothetical protein
MSGILGASREQSPGNYYIGGQRHTCLDITYAASVIVRPTALLGKDAEQVPNDEACNDRQG